MLVRTTGLSDVRGIDVFGKTKAFGASRLARSGGYGTLFCPELNTAVGNLGTTLQQAQASGVDTTNAQYQAAQQLYNQQTSYITGDYIDFGSGCTEAVNQVKTQIANVNALIIATNPANPPAVIDPDSIPTPASTGLFPSIFGSLPSWVLPAGIGLLAVIGVGVILWSPIGRGIGHAVFRKKKEPSP